MSFQNKEFIPLSIPFLGGNEEHYLRECVSTNFVSSVGPFVNKFESFLCKITGFKHCTAVSSGTSALQVALLANGVEKNDLVIMPSYTFIATANAISHCGAEPWIFDISIHPDYIGHGLGRLLLNKVNSILKDKGYPIVGLAVTSHNKRAKSLYSSYGFKEVETFYEFGTKNTYN